MNTLYLSTSEQDLAEAAKIIRAGGLVGFPTETVYGLGGNALDAESSKKIYAAKGRPSDNPLIVHISSISQIDDIAYGFTDTAKKLADAIWPGPMTMVFPKKTIVPDETTGGLNTVAVRLPADEAARRLIELSEVPIAAPSANLSGRPSPTKWEHVKNDLDGRADAIIMGSPCIGGIESTVIDMTGDFPQILRPGLITPERVTEVTGLFCDYDPAIKGRPDPALIPKAPGMKYKHYAPSAEMHIYTGDHEKIMQIFDEASLSAEKNGTKLVTISYKDGKDAAEHLFADLRRADEEEKADIIYAEALPMEDSVSYSVMNRMLKSAGYNITEV